MLLKAEKLTTGAVAIAHDEDGRTVFLPGVLPGESVYTERLTEKRGSLFSLSHEIAEPSLMRRVPSCPYSSVCGGCDFDFVSAKDSACLKEEIVKDNLRRISKLEHLPPFDTPAYTDEARYRARVRVHYSMKDRKAGFLKKNSNEIVEIRSCPLLEERLDDEVFRSGEALKRCRGMMFSKGVNRKTGLVELQFFNGDDRLSAESEEVVRTVDGVPYHVTAGVFFQSNPTVLPELFSFVRENVTGNEIMDLYSGVGTFSALFEGSGKRVTAVERQKECLRLSAKNAPSASSYTDDVYAFASRTRTHVDTVIVDPPRTGLDKGVPALIESFDPETIIYVSCDSVTLARDIPSFTRYRPVKARVFDFYRGSSHEETAIVLSKVQC
ncbi:MAG: class I SAM-dependent RNA methyltransferase [Bullifex sp.]